MWYREDYGRFPAAEIDLRVHGLKHFGPVHPVLGRLEYQRSIAVLTSIRAAGFDRHRGHVLVDVLKRADQLLFLSSGGYHRKAAMAAINEDTVPALFRSAAVFDVDHVDRWPNVRSGLWSAAEARRYVDHLFDFSWNDWARDHGLLLETGHE